jgi:hypothetical protein
MSNLKSTLDAVNAGLRRNGGNTGKAPGATLDAAVKTAKRFCATGP